MGEDMQNPPAGEPRGDHCGDESAPQSTGSAADLLARARRHDYALAVTYERADGRVCVALVTTMLAAERKVLRTRARGLRAEVTLVRLVPVAAPRDAVERALVLADDTEGVAL